ncbi:CoA-transferase (plasmid) [Sinorhizobium meliloti]|nr:CoA-transferase [Sinorhizobium meliloti]WQO37415.1 CoA-transferase [Sinorhizobium meliloti]WQO77886.1 CoA-transferase [Sinorhizobium meliloti]
MSLNAKARFLKRAASDILGGMTVNLRIGLPTEVLQYVSLGTKVCLYWKTALRALAPVLSPEKADRNLIDAGGAYVSAIPGTSFFDSAASVAIVRSGRLDLSLLGAFQVSGTAILRTGRYPANSRLAWAGRSKWRRRRGWWGLS